LDFKVRALGERMEKIERGVIVRGEESHVQPERPGA
jgi:hypothetical protein